MSRTIEYRVIVSGLRPVADQTKHHKNLAFRLGGGSPDLRPFRNFADSTVAAPEGCLVMQRLLRHTSLILPSRISPVQVAHWLTMKKPPKTDGFFMEGQEGLEPSTCCLRGRSTNQLSYWPAWAGQIVAGNGLECKISHYCSGATGPVGATGAAGAV